MKKSAQLLSTLFCFAVGGSALHAADGVWTKTAAAAHTWSTAANWSGSTIADGVGFTADFSTVNFATGQQTIRFAQYAQTNKIGDTTPAAGTSIRFRDTMPTLTAGLTVNCITPGHLADYNCSLSGGPLVKIGPGTMALSGANTFTGFTITVGGGILQQLGGNRLGGCSQLILQDGSTLQLNTVVGLASQGEPVSVAGVVTMHNILAGSIWNIAGYISDGSSAGSIIVTNGAGRLIFSSATNTFSGDFTAFAGVDITKLANSGVSSSLGMGTNITIGSGAKISFQGDNADTSNRPWVLGTGGGTIENASTNDVTLTLSGGVTGTGNPLIIASNRNVTITGTGINTSTGGTLTKNGSGVLTINAACDYTGATTVNGGKLLVNNSLATSAVTIQPGCTLGGTGTILGSTTVTNGTLSPGTSIGTLTLTLAPTVDSTSTTLMEINRTNAPNADKLVVSPAGGTLAFNGTLTVTYIGDALIAGDTFDLFDADAFSGSFSVTNLPALDVGLVWNTSQLQVSGTISVEATGGCTPAVVSAGSDQTVCASSPTVTLAGSFAVASSATWSGGAGNFTPNNTTTNATYTPSAGEITAGTVTLTLTTSAGGTCGATNDSMTITINPVAIVDAGTNQTICANHVANLAGSFGGGATSATWTTSGDGKFGNNTLTNTTYTPGAADKAAGTVNLTLTTDDPSGPCGVANDVMTLLISTPVVSIARQDTNVVVSWTITCGDYILEAKGDIDPSVLWSPVIEPVVPVGNANTVTVPIGSTNQFFRLRYTPVLIL